MVDLKCQMAKRHETLTGETFSLLWASRFDQQNSTKLHVDSGPDENFLMLGYEPSMVASELEIADYSKCALDLGITPTEFLSRHNPMFEAGYELLRDYLIPVPCFSATDYQIVCINNSTASFCSDGSAWQGTLHKATVPAPDESQRRIINSIMVTSVPAASSLPGVSSEPTGAADKISTAEIEDFIATDAVRRRGYDKQHLEDDD